MSRNWSKVQSPRSKVDGRSNVVDLRAPRLDRGLLRQLVRWVPACIGVVLIYVAGTGCVGLSTAFRPAAIRESNRLVEDARAACEKGDHERAKRLLARASRIAPDDPDLQRDIGRALLLSGERDAAVTHFQYATRHGADDPEPYLELARILFDAHRYDECQEAVNAALQLVPTLTEAQLLKGKLAEINHHDDKALEIYYRILGDNPSDYEAMLRIAGVLVREDRSSQAAPILRTVAESDHVTPRAQQEAHWALGIVYGREHRWAEAATQLDLAAELHPKLSADDLYQLAYAHWEAGQLGPARDYVTRALDVDPTHADARALAQTVRARSTATQTAYTRPPVPAPKIWQ
jgi:tetratricopeptide (TPR) repeat protein